MFQTLPITGYGTLDGQDVNLIDPDQIRTVVQHSFTDHTTISAPPTSTVDVVNSSGRDGAAANTAAALRAQGFTTGTLGTGTPRHTSTVAYGNDASTDAQTVAQVLGGLPTTPDSHLLPGHVQVILGQDYIPPSTPSGVPAANTAPPGTAGATPPSTPQHHPLRRLKPLQHRCEWQRDQVVDLGGRQFDHVLKGVFGVALIRARCDHRRAGAHGMSIPSVWRSPTHSTPGQPWLACRCCTTPRH